MFLCGIAENKKESSEDVLQKVSWKRLVTFRLHCLYITVQFPVPSSAKKGHLRWKPFVTCRSHCLQVVFSSLFLPLKVNLSWSCSWCRSQSLHVPFQISYPFCKKKNNLRFGWFEGCHGRDRDGWFFDVYACAKVYMEKPVESICSISITCLTKLWVSRLNICLWRGKAFRFSAIYSLQSFSFFGNIKSTKPVSYTHLTLPTTAEV